MIAPCDWSSACQVRPSPLIVSIPEIRKWLGQVVGKEAEDLSRHDKWLCMMYPRLALLREMLRDDGVIFISIGKDELPSNPADGGKGSSAIFLCPQGS